MNGLITFPGGFSTDGSSPVVLLGPNGAGKTRMMRDVVFSPDAVEFINALRNPSAGGGLPYIPFQQAKAQADAERSSLKHNHSQGFTNEFASLLAKLGAERVSIAIEFTRAFKAKELSSDSEPTASTLDRVADLWAEMLPGREIVVGQDSFVIRRADSLPGSGGTYDPMQASDGEKSILYCAARVLDADPGFLVIDEPELHLHSLLARRVWDLLEDARPDVRFVYVTHDVGFATSRRHAQYLRITADGGVQDLGSSTDVAASVAADLIGAATVSFSTPRLALCEGTKEGLDSRLYRSWFNSVDTSVIALGSCEEVLRYQSVVQNGSLLAGAKVIAIIDRDVRSKQFLDSVSTKVFVLGVHEVESLYSLPNVVEAVCDHLRRPWDETEYRNALLAQFPIAQRESLAIQRWKSRMETLLVAQVSNAGKSGESIESLRLRLAAMMDSGDWDTAPADLLEREVASVHAIFDSDSSIDQILQVLPGKPLLPAALRSTGLNRDAYVNLICTEIASGQGEETEISSRLVRALAVWLPSRSSASSATAPTT